MTAQEFISQALASLSQTTENPRYRLPLDTESTAVLLAAAYEQQVGKRARVMEKDSSSNSKIRSVAKWLTADNLKPGLLLCGGIGNGKSTMLTAIKALNNQFLNFKSWRQITLLSATFISSLAADSDATAYSRAKDAPILGIDDLGTEPVSVKRYGSEINPVVELICYRYDQMLPTMITTNLTMEKIRDVYGERVADRLKEMCEVLTYTENSFRK